MDGDWPCCGDRLEAGAIAGYLGDRLISVRGRAPRPVKRREKPPDPEREKWEQILVNLERYDGTARGQKRLSWHEPR